MARFPPADWVIRPLDQMGAFTINSNTRELLVSTLLAVQPSDEAEGFFQVVLGGLKTIDFSVQLTDVIPHPAMINLELSAQLQPGVSAIFKQNSVVTNWMDLKDLVASQDMDIVDAEGESKSEDFLKLIEKLQEGAVIRWALAATTIPEQPLELRLQTLPLPLSKVKTTPALLDPTAATNTLIQIPLGGDFFNSPDCLGPIPLLFSKDEAATRTWTQDREKVHAACQGLYSKFLQLEVLSAKDTVAYVANPRPGVFKQPLLRDYTGEKSSKQQKTSEDTVNSHTQKQGIESLLDLARLTVSSTISTPPELHQTAFNLIRASLSQKSWIKYQSGWNCFRKYAAECDFEIVFPIENRFIRGFIVWASHKGLTASTIKSYLSAISLVHNLLGFNRNKCQDDMLADLLLKGASKSENTITSSNTRRAMNLPLLEILGHHISASSWSQMKKLAVWACCTCAFFASARMGEFLGDSKGNTSKALKWENVHFYEDRMMIKLNSRKTAWKGGVLDLFAIPAASYCPVLAMLKLKAAHAEADPAKLVFTIDNSKPLLISEINQILRDCFKNVCTNNIDSITSHSFRAAIPTAMMRSGLSGSDKIVKQWGGWSSNCYTVYAKLDTGEKKVYFDKILTALKKHY